MKKKYDELKKTFDEMCEKMTTERM